MLKSLYSGVSGMRGFQTKMDVIANNIANVNTTAFKASRARFQDMLSQTIANAQSPNASGRGGVNSQQVGLGVKVGAIDTMMGGGALQPTGRDLDFGIEGNGFFAVSSDGGATISYTRDGAFFRDYNGNLVNSNGERILGYVNDGNDMDNEDWDFEIIGDEDNPPELAVPDLEGDKAENLKLLTPLRIPDTIEGGTLKLESYTIDGSGQIIGVYSDGENAETYLLGQVGMVSFSNPEGLTKLGNNNYTNSNNSGVPDAGLAGTGSLGIVRQGFLEMSNVDLANEFTEMIIASKAYSANSRSISTSDEMLQELINLKR